MISHNPPGNELTVGTEKLHGICVVGRQLKVCRNILLKARGCILKISRNVGKDILVTKVANSNEEIVEARVVGSQSVVLGSALWDNHKVKEITRGVVGQFRHRDCFVGRTKET